MCQANGVWTNQEPFCKKRGKLSLVLGPLLMIPWPGKLAAADFGHGHITTEAIKNAQNGKRSLVPACVAFPRYKRRRNRKQITCQLGSQRPVDRWQMSSLLSLPAVRDDCIFLFSVYCLNPPVVQHATHNGAPDADSFPLETVLKYACYPGYVTVGFAHAKCFLYNDTAQWFGPDITCKGITA